MIEYFLNTAACSCSEQQLKNNILATSKGCSRSIDMHPKYIQKLKNQAQHFAKHSYRAVWPSEDIELAHDSSFSEDLEKNSDMWLFDG